MGKVFHNFFRRLGKKITFLAEYSPMSGTPISLLCDLSSIWVTNHRSLTENWQIAQIKDWWSLVRSWNWQRINVKIHEELEDYVDEGQRLFGKFEEVGVLKNTERSNHMDMGEFQKYLESHNCQWVFKELFTLWIGQISLFLQFTKIT